MVVEEIKETENLRKGCRLVTREELIQDLANANNKL